MIFDNRIFSTTFRLLFRIYIKDLIRYRYKIFLNILMAVSSILVAIIIDVDELSSLTGSDNPWIFILAGFLVATLINATFHMPRAFAENDIGSGRFEYIMTTSSYSINYFWYYSVSLLIIELLNLVPVIIGFIIFYLISGTQIIAIPNIMNVIVGLILFIFAFVLTILISTLNLYSSIISRRYKLNSSLVLLSLTAFAGQQFPYHAFPDYIQYVSLLNPLTISIELWRTIVVPGYQSFIHTGYLIISGMLQILVLIGLSQLMIKKMNRSIRINGVGKLLE